MIQVLIKEVNGFLSSLIAYMVMGVFLTSMGLLMWVFPETSVLDYGYADMDTLFSMSPYVFIFLIPAITMKSFAEEKKMGTLELLFTKPLSDLEIILGKWMASFLLVVITLLPTLVYYFSVSKLGNPSGNIDTPGAIGSYIGLVLLGGVFCSVGIFASSLSSNQIVAFILAAFLCFILYAGFESLSALWEAGNLSLFVRQVGMFSHYEALSRGLIDARDLIYFLSVTGIMILFTKTVIGRRQW